MKQKITVLGAGMVGRVMAADLSKSFDVTVADLNETSLKEAKKNVRIKTLITDFTNPTQIQKAIAQADLVVGAVPGHMGFNMLKTVIEARKNIVDISFFPEDAFTLNKLALKNNVTAIVDCGVAPGMDNIILGYHYHCMKVNRFVCFVGGLPVQRIIPWQYKAPFSPIDVIEEYTRPARLMENGKVVIRPALSEPELLHFDNIGTLEAFNTDGLRTLLQLKVPFMIEKTLRYPGHIEFMKVLRDTGFFSNEEVEIKGLKVRPIDVVGKLLFKHWKYEKGEEDFTVMRVIVEGSEDKNLKRYTYNLLDRYDHTTNTSSMSRTTGYTATAAVNLLLCKQYNSKGIISPEMLGKISSCFDFILNYLKARGVNYTIKEEII
jgi:saccharopine dehydrogenase-like NADP-dependent oxidoreductase